MSVNPISGFSIATYTGTGANATVGHGLGVAPKMVIVKHRQAGGSSNWPVYHASNPPTGTVWLNVTNSFSTSSGWWNDTVPTASVFTLGINNDDNNSSGRQAVAYCFAEIPGYSKIGSYVGNGSADGPFVNCGFRPKWLLVRRVDSTGNWSIRDTSRNPTNAMGQGLFANVSNAESLQAEFDFLTNGFKCRDAGGLETNNNGSTYIFMAIAEFPFRYANAR